MSPQKNELVDLLEYVSRLCQRILDAMERAKKNLKNSQARMKTWYDGKPSGDILMLGRRYWQFCLSQANHSKPGTMGLMR